MGHFPKGFRTFAQYNRRQHLIPWGAAPITQPPFDATHNVWTFDPDAVGAGQYITGPTGTVTTPVKTQGAGGPSYYTFGATDAIDFGDALDTTWTNGVGWTIYCCFKPSTADLVVANSPFLVKSNAGATVAEFQMLLNSNKVDAYVAYGGTFSNYNVFHTAAASLVAGTRYVFALTYDPTLVGSARGVTYLNGSPSTDGVPGTVGTPATVSDTAAPLRIGQGSGAVAPPSVISYTAAYNVVHSAATVASISSWYQNTKGWK